MIDDEDIDVRFLYDLIHLKRANYLKNHLNQGMSIDDSNAQEIVLDMESVDTTEDYGELGIGVSFKRSVNTLPEVLMYKGGYAIRDIHTVDFSSTNIPIKSFDHLKVLGNGRFTHRFIGAALRNNKIWLKSGNLDYKVIDKVVVNAIFTDPTKVSGYDIKTSDYPISDGFIDYIKNDILNSDIKFLLTTRKDLINDAEQE